MLQFKRGDENNDKKQHEQTEKNSLLVDYKKTTKTKKIVFKRKEVKNI